MLSVDDLFPPPGHRYLTEDDMEHWRALAISGDDVTMPGLTVLHFICDWRNMKADLASAAVASDVLRVERDRSGDSVGPDRNG